MVGASSSQGDAVPPYASDQLLPEKRVPQGEVASITRFTNLGPDGEDPHELLACCVDRDGATKLLQDTIPASPLKGLYDNTVEKISKGMLHQSSCVTCDPVTKKIYTGPIYLPDTAPTPPLWTDSTLPAPQVATLISFPNLPSPTPDGDGATPRWGGESPSPPQNGGGASPFPSSSGPGRRLFEAKTRVRFP